MGTTQPIRDLKEIQELKDYFQIRGETRNYLLIVMGLNTALRISDILRLKWKDVYNFNKRNYRDHIVIKEKKTGKISKIVLNHSVLEALELCKDDMEELQPEIYLFKSRNGDNRPISRSRAFTIIQNAGQELGIEKIACHSLRKTFGYQAWKNGVPPALLMSIYNHSSYEITKRYLGINQEERDKVFLHMTL